MPRLQGLKNVRFSKKAREKLGQTTDGVPETVNTQSKRNAVSSIANKIDAAAKKLRGFSRKSGRVSPTGSASYSEVGNLGGIPSIYTAQNVSITPADDHNNEQSSYDQSGGGTVGSTTLIDYASSSAQTPRTKQSTTITEAKQLVNDLKKEQSLLHTAETTLEQFVMDLMASSALVKQSQKEKEEALRELHDLEKRTASSEKSGNDYAAHNSKIAKKLSQVQEHLAEERKLADSYKDQLHDAQKRRKDDVELLNTQLHACLAELKELGNSRNAAHVEKHAREAEFVLSAAPEVNAQMSGLSKRINEETRSHSSPNTLKTAQSTENGSIEETKALADKNEASLVKYKAPLDELRQPVTRQNTAWKGKERDIIDVGMTDAPAPVDLSVSEDQTVDEKFTTNDRLGFGEPFPQIANSRYPSTSHSDSSKQDSSDRRERETHENPSDPPQNTTTGPEIGAPYSFAPSQHPIFSTDPAVFPGGLVFGSQSTAPSSGAASTSPQPAAGPGSSDASGRSNGEQGEKSHSARQFTSGSSASSTTFTPGFRFAQKSFAQNKSPRPADSFHLSRAQYYSLVKQQRETEKEVERLTEFTFDGLSRLDQGIAENRDWTTLVAQKVDLVTEEAIQSFRAGFDAVENLRQKIAAQANSAKSDLEDQRYEDQADKMAQSFQEQAIEHDQQKADLCAEKDVQIEQRNVLLKKYLKEIKALKNENAKLKTGKDVEDLEQQLAVAKMENEEIRAHLESHKAELKRAWTSRNEDTVHLCKEKATLEAAAYILQKMIANLGESQVQDRLAEGVKHYTKVFWGQMHLSASRGNSNFGPHDATKAFRDAAMNNLPDPASPPTPAPEPLQQPTYGVPDEFDESADEGEDDGEDEV